MAIKTSFTSVKLSGDDAEAFLRQAGLDKEMAVIHKGDQLEREAKILEQKASNELDPEKRQRLLALAASKRKEERNWRRAR